MIAERMGQFARMRFQPAVLAIAAVLVTVVANGALAEPSGCTLVANDHSPSEKILRCGSDLTVRSRPNTKYKVITKGGESPPTGAELDSGALLIEGTRKFQILTPHASAAVRGTKWAVEVIPKRTSALVISGVVVVTRGKQQASLRAGEGVDVSPGIRQIQVKRWKKKRVKALLAGFGQ